MVSTGSSIADIPSRTPAHAWFQPVGWWRERGASDNALRLAMGQSPQAPLLADMDREGYTLWHYWADGHCAEHRFQALADSSLLADATYLHHRAKSGEHPFHRLMLRGQLAAAQAWKAHFGLPQLDLATAPGDDMLLAACWSGNPDLISWLLEQGASPGHADEQGLTALMVAIHRCNSATAMGLVLAGADPDERDRQGKNALHHAAALGLVEIFPQLEDAGADAHLPDNAGATPTTLLERTLRSEAACVDAARGHWLRRYQARLSF